MSSDWDARSWLLAVLRGDADIAMPGTAGQQASALQAAREEGVVSLVHAALCESVVDGSIPESLLALFADAAREAAARGLWMLGECRRISAALSDAGVQSIWLKGVALAQWLYPQPHLRDFDDIDLLLCSHDETLRAAAAVAPLGYVLPNRYVAGDLVVHELLAFSQHAQLELDLHWGLSNKALFAERLQWDELWADAVPLSTLGEHARGLTLVHALLHAVIHRTLNQLTDRGLRLRWLYDLHLMAGRMSPADWQGFEALAIGRGLAGASHDALDATMSAFHTQVPAGMMRTLAMKAQTEPMQCDRLGSWAYMQWATFRILPGWRTRARWLRQLLIPDMRHLRERYGDEDASDAIVVVRRLRDGLRRLRGYL